MSATPEYEHTIIPRGGENPNNWEHPEIKDAFDPLLVEDATNQADKYWQMRQLWEQGLDTFIRSTRVSLAQAWSGPAADQARQAIEDYIDKQARPVTPALEALSTGVRAAADAIVRTKHSVGEPLQTDSVKGFFNRWLNGDEISRRTERARVAMATHYITPFSELDTKIPVIPVPTGPTGTSDIPAPPPGGYPGTSNPTTSDTSNPAGTPPGGTPTGRVPDDPESEPQQEAPGDQASRPAATTPSDTATTPAGTELPGSTTPTIPASTTPAGLTTGPGSPGGTPSGAAPGSPDSQAPGRTVAGAPNTAQGAPAGAATAAASTASGTRGMTGMPMAGAAGRGGGKDDESGRSTPDYLISQENTDELLGEIPRTIPGGVIGTNPD